VIPIAFTVVGDPVGSGLVTSLARPGGNVTGLSTQYADAAGKRLELPREVIPKLRRLAIMANFGNSARCWRGPAKILQGHELRVLDGRQVAAVAQRDHAATGTWTHVLHIRTLA
jgi:hypothetical protein